MSPSLGAKRKEKIGRHRKGEHQPDPDKWPGYALLKPYLDELPTYNDGKPDYPREANWSFLFQCKHEFSFLVVVHENDAVKPLLSKAIPRTLLDARRGRQQRFSHFGTKEWGWNATTCTIHTVQVPTFDTVLTYVLWAKACPLGNRFCTFVRNFGGG